MFTYLSMYRALPEASRELIRAIRYTDKVKQTILRMDTIDHEWYELQLEIDEMECCSQRCCNH